MYPKLIENLIERLTKLPGVGRRSAERMVFWMLGESKENIYAFASAITDLKDGMRFCVTCHNLSDHEMCSVCSNPHRDQSMICVVESPKDLISIEKSGVYKGLYHVLLGTISPSDGRGPEDLTINHLLSRATQPQLKEIVIATDPDSEGEMTALYLSRELNKMNVKVSRIGLGIPVGSSVEFADISTLGMSLNARRTITAED